VQAGSRRRHLTLKKDNAGFLAWAKQQHNLIAYLKENPTHRLFGEWLVPHSLKTYEDNAWNKFYVFDVAIDKKEHEIKNKSDSTLKYLVYDIYKPLLEKHSIDFISPLVIIENASDEQLYQKLKRNVFLIKDGKGAGEGIVIKRYDFVNRYGRTTWAKIVTSEFKHYKTVGKNKGEDKQMIEEKIAGRFTTKAICEKVYAKIILNKDGWNNKLIPQLLGRVYYDVVIEEIWSILKKYKNPIIDFGKLKYFVCKNVKIHLPELFNKI